MGVYIKGMKMPTRCEDCPVCHYMERGTITACGCKATMMIRPIDCNSRPSWCPLVPVPPHGGLIEKNAVFKLIQSMPSVDKLLPVEFMKALQEIPTIISAEEGE